METLLTVWSADRIKDAWQHGRKPLVVKLGDNYIDLGFRGLARIDSDHLVTETPHEIVIQGKGKHFRRGGNHQAR